MINISDSATKLNSLNRRMFILAAAKIIILGGIVSRLFFLQVKENKKYLTLSDKNRIREWKLPPIRGEFQDYFGNTIAGNFEAYQLHIIPEEVEDFRYVIYRVKELLELSEKQFKKIISYSQKRIWSSKKNNFAAAKTHLAGARVATPISARIPWPQRRWPSHLASGLAMAPLAWP